MNTRVRGAVGGFAAAIGVFAVLFWTIDIAQFFQALRQADPIVIGLMVVGACGWLTAWSLSFHTVLGVLDGDLPVWRSVLAYASALRSNNITPFGQAGGEPVAAVFISRISSVEYETALASIASVDAINFAPSITFALLGVASYALFATLGQSLLIAGLVVIALALIVPILLFLGWKYRYLLEQRAIAVLAPRLHSIGARIPRVSAPTPASIAHSIEHFFASIERRLSRFSSAAGSSRSSRASPWVDGCRATARSPVLSMLDRVLEIERDLALAVSHTFPSVI